jgi:toxin CptA
MWSDGSETPLRAELRPSRRLFLLLCGSHLGAAASVLAAAIPLWLQMPALAALGLSAWRVLRRYARLSDPRSVRALATRTANAWELRLASGETVVVERLPTALVHPWLVIVHFRAGRERRWAVPVMADMLDSETHRRLRVRLVLERSQD